MRFVVLWFLLLILTLLLAIDVCTFPFIPASWRLPLSGVLLYLSLSWAILAVLYFRVYYLHRQDGWIFRSSHGIARWVRFLCLPYILMTYFTLLLRQLLSRENTIDAITDSLYLSGRLWPWHARQFEQLKIAAVLDLCAELPEVGFIRQQVDYLEIALLDGTAPDLRSLQIGVDWLVQRVAEGKRVLIHCAAGHGRSATYLAAVLLRTGHVKTMAEAQWLMRRVRPGVRLKRGQRQVLESYCRWPENHLEWNAIRLTVI